jgi:pyruvate/2-oxoglutarate dehydrogenase complex dihydrolipoamide dehydrogenase (E3) component
VGTYDYDLIVMGGGAAGMVSAKLAAGLGKKVAMIEKDHLGGECTHYGCVPSKTLIKSANTAHYTRELLASAGLGNGASLLLSAGSSVMEHVRSVRQQVYEGHKPKIFEKLGIKVLIGDATFVDNHQIEINGKRLTAARFVLATGSSAFVPPIDGINSVPYLTNESFFDLERLPASMIVLGGGPIGTELSQALARLGVEVTIVEMLDQILIREEKELRDLFAERLAAEGVTILTGTKAVKLWQESGTIHLATEDQAKNQGNVVADAVLVALGRKANVEGLHLENAGVQYTPKGIATNEELRTSAQNIYACGDVVGPYQFSHMAEYQARIATRNAILPLAKRVDYTHYVWCMFTDPELAHAGLTEEEARKQYGDSIRVYRWEYKATDRGRTDGEEIGLSKIICDAKFRIIGAHILGSRAGDVMHEVQAAKTLGLPLHKLDGVIHIYPTFSDVIKQPAKLAYIDWLRSRFYVRLASMFLGRKKAQE